MACTTHIHLLKGSQLPLVLIPNLKNIIQFCKSAFKSGAPPTFYIIAMLCILLKGKKTNIQHCQPAYKIVKNNQPGVKLQPFPQDFKIHWWRWGSLPPGLPPQLISWPMGGYTYIPSPCCWYCTRSGDHNSGIQVKLYGRNQFYYRVFGHVRGHYLEFAGMMTSLPVPCQ